MRTANDHQRHRIESAGARRRQIRLIQVIFAGAATIATLVLFNAARPGDAATDTAAGPLLLVSLVTDLPAPATDDNDPADIAGQDAQQTAQADIDLGDQETQQAEQQGADTRESILGPTLTGLP